MLLQADSSVKKREVTNIFNCTIDRPEFWDIFSMIWFSSNYEMGVSFLASIQFRGIYDHKRRLVKKEKNDRLLKSLTVQKIKFV